MRYIYSIMRQKGAWKTVGTSLDRDEFQNLFLHSRIKFLISRLLRMSPKLGLQYASCCERCKACDWLTLEAGFLQTNITSQMWLSGGKGAVENTTTLPATLA